MNDDDLIYDLYAASRCGPNSTAPLLDMAAKRITELSKRWIPISDNPPSPSKVSGDRSVAVGMWTEAGEWKDALIPVHMVASSPFTHWYDIGLPPPPSRDGRIVYGFGHGSDL